VFLVAGVLTRGPGWGSSIAVGFAAVVHAASDTEDLLVIHVCAIPYVRLPTEVIAGCIAGRIRRGRRVCAGVPITNSLEICTVGTSRDIGVDYAAP